MKVVNVHSREIAAPADRIGALLESLGGHDDRLWPVDRWPDLPMKLDRPLAVGARGGHGPIRYAVEEHEPGHRAVFRFDRRVGLDGTHSFEVEPLGPEHTRLTHTIDGRLRPRMLARWAVVRRYHDAVLEDLLDRAEEEATGRRPRSAPRPTLLRVVDSIDSRLGRRRPRTPRPVLARAARVGVPVTLGGLAALHAAWAAGSSWPARDERRLAEYVLSASEREQLGGMPPRAASAAVAAALAVAAAVVAAAGAGAPSLAVCRAARGVAGVFLIRGVVYVPLDIRGGLQDRYDRADLAVYSPLCLALAAGTALATRG